MRALVLLVPLFLSACFPIGGCDATPNCKPHYVGHYDPCGGETCGICDTGLVCASKDAYGERLCYVEGEMTEPDLSRPADLSQRPDLSNLDAANADAADLGGVDAADQGHADAADLGD